ncbi:hypothetical protein M436DRAFT_76853 [Aureobasidium namibiae CBS 147.97]|uniref:NAD-dependent epimerase/dehydratase domain-containing protein n=1 Tax=Aureobasidium namibiae CBS 147.97 TaxID=1043004 RepID=A0A074WFG3_9PEZI
MTAISIAGSTGLVGSHILTLLKQCSQFDRIHAFSRRDLPAHAKLTTIGSQNSTDWPSTFPQNTSAFFSALGTTARIAGSFTAQRKIDYDLNLALAQSARAAGVQTYVLISTSGELDEAVKEIGFEHVIILKPGLLVGIREDSRPGEFMGRSMASFLGKISGGMLKDAWAQDADVVARAAVWALLDVTEKSNDESVRVLNQQDVIRLGRTEWKDFR